MHRKYGSQQCLAVGVKFIQCPRVSDVLKSWGMSECRRATTLGSHDSWKQQVSTVEVPEQIPLQSDVRLAQKCAGAMLWLSTRSRPDLSYCVSRMASLCSKDPSSSLMMRKRLCRFLSGTSDHGLALKPHVSVQLFLHGNDVW